MFSIQPNRCLVRLRFRARRLGFVALVLAATPVIAPFNSYAASAEVEAALISGDAREVVGADELLSAAIEEIDGISGLLLEERIDLFNLDTDGTAKTDGSSLDQISWDPSWDAGLLTPTAGKNVPLLSTNAVAIAGRTVREKPIAIVGQTAHSRYLAFGGNPMRNIYRGGSVSADMQQLLANSLGWLTGRDDLASQPFNVVIAQMAQSYYFPDQVATRSWLDQHFTDSVAYNAAGTCNSDALASCISANTDLLIISQSQTADTDPAAIKQSVANAMEAGVPVLYLHLDGHLTALGRELLTLWDVNYESDNRWQSLSLENWSPVGNLNATPAEFLSIRTMLSHFLRSDYAFDWSSCDGENCSAVTGLRSEFLDGAETVRTIFRNFDINKRDIFSDEGLRLQRLLILIADRFRQDVIYPMDKQTSDDNAFLRSLFSDYAQYHYRAVNPAQSDMGNFSRSDFSHITPTARRVVTTSKRYFRSSGAYALPGKTVTVTRNDDSDLTVKVFINTLRSGATHHWASNGYNRPKFLQSSRIAIEPGETIELTSAYGGPIQLEFSTNDLPVDITFENIGEHAYWAGSDDDDSFTSKLDAGDYDWAELVTPGFEVHSKLDKMRSSMNDSKWGSARALADATMRYMHNFPHALAGFTGTGIEPIEEVNDIADAHGWQLDNLDVVKHMNADQATCGYGCSGNPYDAYWSYSPVGHGDVHELGHGLQGGMRFVGWENHSMTNHYSYYTKSKYHETTGSNPQCQSLPFQRQFGVLQQSANVADSMQYMHENWWASAGWSEQASMLIQMMMSAQYHGALENGWHLRALLHIVEREFNRADNNESSWNTKRQSLGFGALTLAQARDLDNNDWILIAASWATGLDFRDYLKMWGIPFSAQANEQVATYGFLAAERRYFISSGNGYCLNLQNGDFLGKTSLPVDGRQIWPVAEDADGDGYWNKLDNCPAIPNREQNDLDADGAGDACDSLDDRDPDEDGVPNHLDAFPDDPNEHLDSDDDGIGNNADPDDDNDLVEDEFDRFPFDETESSDNDNDGLGDNADTDDDQDQVTDLVDNCPINHNPLQQDEDGDKMGNACDADYSDEICFPINNNNRMVMICL